MGAIKFVEEYRRMYKVIGKHLPTLAKGISAKDVVKEVEEWSATPPRKTMQSVFLKQYPETEIDVNGVVQICPMSISAAHRDSNGECNNPEQMCRDCRREFWMQEVE